MRPLSSKPSLEKIWRKHPFKSLLKITNIEDLKGERAVSGTSFRITGSDGKRYKLRFCWSRRSAREMERNIRRLAHLFPHFYGRDGKYLLFEWMENATNLAIPLSDRHCFEIGKIIGEVHALEDIKANNGTMVFDRYIKSARKVLPRQAVKALKDIYKKLSEKLDTGVWLEISDTALQNFVQRGDTILYVDEEGLCYRLKGMGLSRALDKKSGISSPEQQREFWRGYNEHYRDDYFDADYRKLTNFLECLKQVHVRIIRKQDPAAELKELLETRWLDNWGQSKN